MFKIKLGSIFKDVYSYMEISELPSLLDPHPNIYMRLLTFEYLFPFQLQCCTNIGFPKTCFLPLLFHHWRQTHHLKTTSDIKIDSPPTFIEKKGHLDFMVYLYSMEFVFDYPHIPSLFAQVQQAKPGFLVRPLEVMLN